MQKFKIKELAFHCNKGSVLTFIWLLLNSKQNASLNMPFADVFMNRVKCSVLMQLMFQRIMKTKHYFHFLVCRSVIRVKQQSKELSDFDQCWLVMLNYIELHNLQNCKGHCNTSVCNSAITEDYLDATFRGQLYIKRPCSHILHRHN